MQGFADLPIRTARLELRPLCEADVTRLFEIHSNPLAMRYWDAPIWRHEERGRAMVARDRALTTQDHLRLGIVAHESRELLGTCALARIDSPSRRTEIGFILDPAHWGRGLMHEAVTGLLNYGFNELNLNRVEAETDPRNERCARLLLRLGFVQEGLFRERCIVEGEVSDGAMYGLLRRDWVVGS